MDSSPKLVWDDPGIYTESCGDMDPTIRDLDQQIILNDMVLCANGGIPYISQDPVLQVNPPPVFDDSWQLYQNEFDGSSSLPWALAQPPQQTQAAASSSQMMMMDANLCDRSRGTPPAPLSENPRSHHPRARAPVYNYARGSVSTGSSDGTSCSAGTPASASATTLTSATSQEPRRNPNVNPANRRAATTQQKKQLYHYHQQQQHGRMLADTQAAAAAHHREAVTASKAEAEEVAARTAAAKAEAEADAVAARTATATAAVTGSPERKKQRDMPEAMRQVAEMGDQLRNAAHEQRKMVDDTLNQWRGNPVSRV
ncbi:hypothetical protein PG991_010215 [Apiospora marii]|uniref:Uncharacterized protein n=1 Tax=Apiospora marii TaxID=335849 RepID=A0ABR1RHV6_9PEZI